MVGLLPQLNIVGEGMTTNAVQVEIDVDTVISLLARILGVPAFGADILWSWPKVVPVHGSITVHLRIKI